MLSDPTRRAKYDIAHQQRQQDRWRLVTDVNNAENDFDLEKLVRLTVLEVLYTRRRTDPAHPALYVLDLEELLGRPREHLEFTIWFLIQTNFVKRADDSRIAITAAGVIHLEENSRGTLRQRRLHAAQPLSAAGR